MPTLETHDGYALWAYIPSLPAATIFAIMFGLATALHIRELLKHKMWFCIPFAIGGVFEFIGYVGRALAYNATGELGPYILQSILLLLAPILFSASLYMTLGRTVSAVRGERYSLIPPRWLTRLFVSCDCFSFLIQASGAGLIVRAGGSTGNKSPALGQNIIVGGLALQVVMFGLFCFVAVVFNLRFRKHAGPDASSVPWQRALAMLYLTSAGIIVRNTFRVIEYAMGQTGYTLTHEWCTYVFDGVLMLGVMMAFWWMWPSRVVHAQTADTDLAPITDKRATHKSLWGGRRGHTNC